LPEYCFAQGLVRLGFLVEEPYSSSAFRTRTLWSILSTHGVTVGVAGWPLSQPAPIVRGFLVADTFHRSALTASGIGAPSALYPPETQPDAVAAMESIGAEADGPDEMPARVDRIYERIAEVIGAQHPTQVSVTRYQSLDPIGHHFL